MRKMLLLLCTLLLTIVTSAQALVQRHPLLDEAFALLEKDNIFQRRYNEITGAQVTSLFDRGVPYFFGGQGRWLTDSHPDYRQMSPWQNSDEYKMDSLYLMGLDCSGFTGYVFEQAGYARHIPLSQILTQIDQRAYQLYSHRKGMNVPADPSKLSETLQVGDMLVAAHPKFHVLLYIGTLADYGFTAEEIPAAADYLHYPLGIHCGANPQKRATFAELIESDKLYSDCLPPVGGVAVSLLGVPSKAATKLGNVGSEHFYGFMIDEDRLQLTIWIPKEPEYYCWYRAPELTQSVSAE